MAKRAAHFVQWPTSFASPPNDALIRGLLELDYEVDVYSTVPIAPYAQVSRYGPKVRTAPFSYGKRWWLRNASPSKWHSYDLFSGTTEDPIGIAGPLSKIFRRPLVVLADEIFSGSYRGDASERWKRLCRWSMRRARFTIVNDESRIPLQREYAGLNADHPVLVYPGCYLQPPAAGNRAVLRDEYGIPEDACVIVYSGTFIWDNGPGWIIPAMQHLPHDVHLLLQPVKTDPLVRTLLGELHCSHRLFFTRSWMTFEESWASMAVADIGLVVYLQDGPQFQNMGVSSTKLCMYLQMGLPVIANPQPSFQFIRDYDCGVLIKGAEEIPKAVAVIRDNYEAMSRNARHAIAEHGQMGQRYRWLKQALRSL